MLDSISNNTPMDLSTNENISCTRLCNYREIKTLFKDHEENLARHQLEIYEECSVESDKLIKEVKLS